MCLYKYISACAHLCVCVYRCKVDVSVPESQGSHREVLLQEGLLCLLGRYISVQCLLVVASVFTGPVKMF